MFDLKLPDYEIIVWIDYNYFGKKLEKEILPVTTDLEVYDESEREGRKVYHWITTSWIQTMVKGGILKDFIGNPNLIFLKLKANNDPNIEDVTLKDNRKFKKI